MNENFQIICIAVIVFLFIAVLISCRLLLDGKPAEDIGHDIAAAKRACDEAGAGIGDSEESAERIISGIGKAEESAERIAETNVELKDRVKQCEQIIEEIKMQRIPD